MKKLLSIVAAIALTVGSYTSAMAQDIFGGLTAVGTIEVNGRGEIKVDPNEFKLSVVIDEQTTNGRTTVSEVEKSMFQALAKVGIDKEQIRMSDMSTASQKRRATNSAVRYQITLNSAAQVQECFAAFDALAISKAEVVSVSNSDIEKYRSEARKLAVDDAMTKAAELAGALGLSVGDCKSIKEHANYSSYPGQPLIMRSNSAAMDGGIVSESLEFTQITVQCNVDATFLSHKKR